MTGPPTGGHRASPAELKAQVEAERGMTPFLVFRDDAGGQHIQVLEDTEPRVTIGRGQGLDLRLDWDGEVSRVHAQLERVGEHWTLADDGLSRNGSYVNSERLGGRRRLHDGDVLRFGRTAMLFRDPVDARRVGSTVVSAEGSPAAELSEAQRRVLVALCRPFATSATFVTPPTNHEIAQELFLSVEAVKTHLRTLFHKFGIEHLPQNQKRARLVELAFVTGQVSKRDLEPSS
jgi:pSer/pThr/pTyr-binding forkhead associated (FHA) protein